jgi:hypothetical protein
MAPRPAVWTPQHSVRTRVHAEAQATQLPKPICDGADVLRERNTAGSRNARASTKQQSKANAQILLLRHAPRRATSRVEPEFASSVPSLRPSLSNTCTVSCRDCATALMVHASGATADAACIRYNKKQSRHAPS